MHDAQPRQTVTFLFTDIEGSTALLKRLGERYQEVLAQHRALIRAALAEFGGTEHGTEGDSFFASFASAAAGVAAAVSAQRALRDHPWPPDGAVLVRMGLHTGEAQEGPSGWVGLDVHRAARLADAGHGGQVLLSEATLALARDNLPAGVSARDLGAHQLKDLPAPMPIHQVLADDLRTDFPPLRSLDAMPNNLPAQLTSFIGRERQVADARALMEGSRLLSLVGPGGTGKTRLALRLATESMTDFPDGAWFIALAPVHDPALVAATALSALGVQSAGGADPKTALLEHLRERRVLLILDNFEQILDAAPLVAELLAASPDSRILVTSRAALHISGEQIYEVPPLAVPDARNGDWERLSQYESVTLFTERAAAVDPQFRLTSDNAAAVAEICARLDGLPLAVELAAARVKLLPPQALLARLSAGLDVVSGQARDLPPRQRTLRGAIAWSYELLTPELQRLFARLAVFRGGWTLEDAEEICGGGGMDVLGGLEALVDHSLVRQLHRAGEPRFAMLETIREFAEEQLEAGGEAAQMRERHGRAFLALAERSAPELMGSKGGELLDRLERELDNLRAAADWAGESDRACALRLGSALWRLWQMRGHLHEGRRRLDALLAAPGDDDDPLLKSQALEALGGVAYWQADMGAASEAYERMIQIERERGDQRRIADGLYNLSFMWLLPGKGELTRRDYERSTALLNEALGMYRGLGDDLPIGRCLWALASGEYERGNTLEREGDADEALTCFERSLSMGTEALAIFRRLDDWFDAGWALHETGITCLRLGRLDQAHELLAEGLELFVAHRDVSGIVLLLDDMADLARRRGRTDDAWRLRGASARMRRQSGTDLAKMLNDAEQREDEEGLDDERRARWDEGTAMDIDDVIALARTL